MIYVDPASPQFEELRRHEQARILVGLGWTIEALMDEYGVQRRTVRHWLDPEKLAKRREVVRLIKLRPEVRAKHSAYMRDYRAKKKEAA